MVIKIVVPRIDGARKDQVADRPAERRAAARRYDLVAVRHDHGRWCEHTTNELERGHAVAEEQADGSPPVKLPRQGLQRVEGRNQDQPCNGSMPGQIGRDCSAEAEADRNDILARPRLLQAPRGFPLSSILPGMRLPPMCYWKETRARWRC